MHVHRMAHMGPLSVPPFMLTTAALSLHPFMQVKIFGWSDLRNGLVVYTSDHSLALGLFELPAHQLKSLFHT